MDTPKPFPPLISDRSPSYERARAERANPSPTADPIVVATLARLFELEEEAAQAYLAAAEASASDEALALQLQGSAEAHAQARTALGERLEALGAAPPREGECRPLLAHGAEAVKRAPDAAARAAELRALEHELSAAHAAAPPVPAP